jgi:integrase
MCLTVSSRVFYILSKELRILNILPLNLGYMLYTVFWPCEDAMRKAGFGGIAKVPSIFSEQWKYQKEASWYLRERACGEAFEIRRSVRRFPKPNSLETYARALTDFLEWCDWVNCKWQDVEYKRDLVDRYQEHMLTGAWSVRESSLKPRTVNLRVDEACHFLRWAAHKELRTPFAVTTYHTSRNYGGASATGESYDVASRTGRVRPDPISLRIPIEQEVQRWLNYIRLKKGATKALMCELIIETGIREQECAQWRTFTLTASKPGLSNDNGYVSVTIEYGAKGQSRRNSRGDVVGPSRNISVPFALAERLHEYAGAARTKSRTKYVNAAKSSPERRRRQLEREDRLFLSEYDGRPITADTLYKAWANVPAEYKPYSEWSPHLGRHYWACMALWDAFLERESMLAQGVVPASDWVTAGATSDLLLLIKPQLGHADEKTTQAYLVWLRHMARAYVGSKSRGHADFSDWLEESE